MSLRLFKSEKPKTIFYLEGILVISFVISFVTVKLGWKDTRVQNRLNNPKFGRISESYHIIHSFLKHPFPDELPKEELEDIGNVDDEPEIIRDLHYLKKIAFLHSSGRIHNTSPLLGNISDRYDFLSDKKYIINQRIRYFQRKYRDFLEHYQPPLAVTFEHKMFYINSLLNTGDFSQAFEEFKEIFKKVNLASFKKYMARTRLARFIQRLDDDFWKEKLFYLLGRKRYREFHRIKKYVKDKELVSLIQAYIFYNRKNYPKVKLQLNKVNSEKYLSNKIQLLIKIDIRENNFDDIFENLKKIQYTNPEIYRKTLYNCASILSIKSEFALAGRLYAKHSEFYEFNNYFRDSEYWKSLWVSVWNQIKYNPRETQKITLLFNKGSKSRIIPLKIANQFWSNQYNGINNDQFLRQYPYNYYYVVRNDRKNARFSFWETKYFLDQFTGKKSTLFYEIIKDIKHLLRRHYIRKSLELISLTISQESLTECDKNMLNLIKSIILYKAKNFQQSFWNFSRYYHPETVRMIPPHFLRSIYFPLRYQSTIDHYCKLRNLDNRLIYSLIREESFYNPRARSYAGAYGLMQIILKTANKFKDAGYRRVRRADLLIPELNISLGTKYFRYLMDRYDGKVPLVLAAYNAGPHRVDQWISTYSYKNHLEFIELIPFTATRNYVKNIIRNYYYYKKFYQNTNQDRAYD